MDDLELQSGGTESLSNREWTPRGYPKLAQLMGVFPESTMLRRFSRLNMLNLLSYQAELIDLEARYLDSCKDDDLSDNLKTLTSDFAKVHESKQPDDAQRKLLGAIRLKIESYSMRRSSHDYVIVNAVSV